MLGRIPNGPTLKGGPLSAGLQPGYVKELQEHFEGIL
jgi:hypothetical protein